MKRRRWLLGGLAAAVFVLPACREHEAPKPAARAAPPALDSIRPETQAELPTTAGEIAMGNLVGQTQVVEGDTIRRPKDANNLQHLIALVTTKAQFTGSIAGRERTLKLAEDLVQLAPTDPRSYVERAQARSAFHLFDEALADLAEAEKLHAKPSDLDEERASIAQARGDLDAALVLRTKARDQRPSIVTRAQLAAVLGELGRTEEAEKLFREAARGYHDVSPFPVAWLFFQEGLMWERAGESGRARAFFQEAHERLPAYVHAASHLARYEPTKAVALLQPAAASSDDPEIELGLATALRKAGDQAGADLHLAHVRARYDELVEKHRAGYAEHAASFWLDERTAPAKALELAKDNLKVRHSSSAFELALLAAKAANAPADGCAIGKEAKAMPHASEMLVKLADEACKDSKP